ncbi:hypothetical protein LSTR_LSTR009240 [Laodelphax striatellus]|uniref:Uncharacterized protein n=1 Tax=Laodelphax striatellus TaxID=195883 RepID=A0A482XD42_LAOST|nr:hypothetical protein LSTR_LSTR009240 [Laodelphax striatellus]
MQLNSENNSIICKIILLLLLNVLRDVFCLELMQNDFFKNNETIDFLSNIRNNSNEYIELSTASNHHPIQNKSSHMIGLSIMPDDKMIDAWSKPDNTFQMFGNPNSRKSTEYPQVSGRKTAKDTLKEEVEKAKSPMEQIDDYKKRVMKFLVQRGFVTIPQPTSTSTEKVKDDLKSTKERGKNIFQAIPVQ